MECGAWSTERKEIIASSTNTTPPLSPLSATGTPTVPVKLQVVRIGELALAAVPCEVFAETGLAIKQASPFKPTFVVELANGYNGYLPTPAQHQLGGYETWPARSAYLEPPAEAKIRASVLELLTAARAG